MTEERNESRVGARFRIVSFKDIEWMMPSTHETIAEGKNPRGSTSIRVIGDHKIDPEKSLIILLITLDYIRINSSDEEMTTLLSYTNEATFEVENFKEVILLQKDGSFAIPAGLLELFVSVTISTIRGILISKTANSDLQGVHVPIITNIRELINSWD